MVKHHFKFRTHQKCRLSELSELVNDEIHKTDDFLPDCMSVMVVAGFYCKIGLSLGGDEMAVKTLMLRAGDCRLSANPYGTEHQGSFYGLIYGKCGLHELCQAKDCYGEVQRV